jgi:hypothetical protein
MRLLASAGSTALHCRCSWGCRQLQPRTTAPVPVLHGMPAHSSTTQQQTTQQQPTQLTHNVHDVTCIHCWAAACASMQQTTQAGMHDSPQLGTQCATGGLPGSSMAPITYHIHHSCSWGCTQPGLLLRSLGTTRKMHSRCAGRQPGHC